MKRSLLFFALSLFSIATTQAQLGTAHDFTVTDIDGNEIHLYSILDEGKVVVLDVSATWCGPCWNLHNNHYLQQLHEMYGPDGTDQIRVIFYEGDANTGMDALLGTGGNTLGNWTEGVTYPIVNETPLQLDLGVYAPLGFPTVNIIRPSDREIIADVYNQNLAGMEASINTIITLGETTNVKEVVANSAAINVFPNPVQDHLVVDLSNTTQTLNYLQVTDATGRVLKQIAIANQTRVEVQLEDLNSGFYFVQLLGADGIFATKKFVKK